MFHYTNSIVNKQGDVLPGYFIQVVNPATGLVAPIYADKSSTPIITVSGVANMAQVDANGMVSFYILDGNYNVNLYAQDATTLKGSYLDVPMVGAISLAIGTVSMLSAGAAPTASIDATSTPAKLNLGLPTTTGATGPAGLAGPAGNASGITQVATLAALGLVTGQAAGDARFLNAPGLEGTFVYKLGDYSAKVAADTKQGLFVAASGIATTVGAWVRVWTGAADIRWFGAVGDDATDDRPAFVGALAALKALSNQTTGDFHATPELYLPMPSKAYYLSAGLNLHQTIHIRGAGSGQPDANGVVLRFAPNVDCIVINDYRTDANTGTTLSNGLGGASGTILEGFSIWGGGAKSITGPYSNTANNGTGRGIVNRTIQVVLRDIFVAFNNGSGVDTHATAGSTGSTQGNANTFLYERVWSIYNGGDGFTTYGNDANAGTMVMCSAVSNAGCGFKDFSFLGNTYIQFHSRDNGVDNTGNNRPVGLCAYAGVGYYMVAGQAAAASTTQPGTNTAVWRTFSNSVSANYRTWTSGLTWTEGSPFCDNPANNNATNVVIGPYAEGAQSPLQITYPTIVVGGLLQAVGGCVGTGTYQKAAVTGLDASNGFSVSGTNYATTFGQAAGQTLYQHTDSVSTRVLKSELNGTVSRLYMDNSFHARTVGMGNDVGNFGPYHYYLARPFVGFGDGSNQTNGLRLGAVNATSDMGSLAIPKGAVLFQFNPVAGGAEKFICTVAGSSYSTATLLPTGIVGGVQTATSADPAAITSTAGVNSVAAPTMAEFNALVSVVNAVRTDLAATRSALATLLANMRTAKQLAP